jgi:acyl carrier protein
VVLDFVRREAAAVLGLATAQTIELRQPLNELGMDSLLSVEFRNRLATALDKPLPATLLFDYPTVETLAGFLGRDVLATDDPKVPDDAGATPPESVIDRVAELSDEDVDRLLAQRLSAGSNS